MKRTTSANMGRRPDAVGRKGSDSNATKNFRTSMMYGSNYAPENDSKSKNILAWAGRVKELIGTYDHGHDARMGQLTRATGYSDLLAACGAEDFADVHSESTTPIKSDTKRTNVAAANSALTKTPLAGTALQRTPEKESAVNATAGEDQKKQHHLPQSMLPSLPRIGIPQETARRAAVSSQNRGGTDPPDTSQKPASRQASQNEVKPPSASLRDASRSPETKSPSRRSPVPDKPISTVDRVSRSGSNLRERKESRESSDVASQRSSESDVKRRMDHSPPVRLQRDIPPSERTSDPTPTHDSRRRDLQTSSGRSRRPAATNIDDDDSDEEKRQSASRRASRRSSKESHDQPKPVPARSSKQNEVDEEFKKGSSGVVRDGRRRAGARESVPATRNSYEKVKSSTQSISHPIVAEGGGNRRRRARGTRVPDTVDLDPTDRTQRSRYAQAARMSRSDDVEPGNYRQALQALAQRLDNKNSERNKPVNSDTDDTSSLESLSQLLMPDADLRRKAGSDGCSQKYDVAEQNSSLESLSQQLTGLRTEFYSYFEKSPTPSPRSSNAEDATNEELIVQRTRALGQRYRQQQKAAADMEETVEPAATSQTPSDLGTPPRADPARPQRAPPMPPQKIPDAPTPELRNFEDPSTLVRSRRRLRSEGGGVKEFREETTSDPSSPRSTKQRTLSAEAPSPRPILRNTTPPAARELARAATAATLQGKLPASAAPQRQRPPTTSPAARAKPARRPAVTDDDDNDVDYPDNSLARRRHVGVGRGLGKVAAVTDLSKARGNKVDLIKPAPPPVSKIIDLSIPPPSPSNRHLKTDPNVPIKASPSSPRSSTPITPSGLTPRRIYQIFYQLMLRIYELGVLILRQFNVILDDFSLYPELANARHNMREIGQRIADDWTLFLTVPLALACIFLAIVLS